MAKSADEGSASAQPKKKESAIVRELKDQGALLGASVGVLWVVQLINAIGGHWLNQLGVIPRTLSGLKGIFFAPFIHASWGHLVSNTVPLFVLGWIVMMRKKRDFFSVAATSGIVSGIGTWIIGRDATHIGASGVVFGLLGYLLSRGVMERKFWSILAAVVALFLYGGVLWGVVPNSGPVSWESHLFGLIGGIMASYFMLKDAKEKAKDPEKPLAKVRLAPADDDAPKLKATNRVTDAEFEGESEEELEKELAAIRRRKLAGPR